jgi:isopentenyl phosphate kinase
MAALYFLKLGGSLITDKDQPHTPRLDVIRRLAVVFHSEAGVCATTSQLVNRFS